MARRAGFTVVETLLAVVIISMLSLVAYPRLRNSIIKTNLRGSRTQVANMLAAARAAAMGSNRSTALEFNGNVATVTATPRRKAGAGTKDTLGTTMNLNTLYGATATLSTGTQVNFDPRGIATNTSGGVVIRLAKSGYTDSVKVDMMGRVTK